MASVLAIVSKAVFAELPVWRVGEHVAGLDRYKSGNPAFDNLTKDDAIFLVTVRDGDVPWLIAIIEKPKATRGVWVGTVNTTPLTDISKELKKLVLASGDGIKAAKGKLGMSLQTPRVLTDDDVALLRKTAPKRRKADPSDRMTMNVRKVEKRRNKSKAKEKAKAELEASGGVPNHDGPPSPAARKLIDQVYASPDDHGLRAVVGDALLEEHHVWGELISLQLADPKKHAKRIKEIIQKHAPDMVGQIVHLSIRKDLVFEDGFLVGCAATKPLAWSGVGRKQWTKAAAAPEWATVKTVKLRPSVVPHWWLEKWLGNKALHRLTHLEIGSSNARRDRPDAPWTITGPQREFYGGKLLQTFLETLSPAELARIPMSSSAAIRELIEKVKNPPPPRPKKKKRKKR